jgi:hypothetical protein
MSSSREYRIEGHVALLILKRRKHESEGGPLGQKAKKLARKVKKINHYGEG